ncbi:hypothetical protein BpHYR1_017995 [Brachionus plicatilis]|uniref:Uncharacterized protein n=1 Tax=Brachionus plicatilis TaxID=10195 RepID=A0A3M7Q7S8_BRAPC|nr:hypothetical protein BpHYR1_017995 [Brachionus plicatilis]
MTSESALLLSPGSKRKNEERPFMLADDPDFKRFIYSLNNKYIIPCRKTVRDKINIFNFHLQTVSPNRFHLRTGSPNRFPTPTPNLSASFWLGVPQPSSQSKTVAGIEATTLQAHSSFFFISVVIVAMIATAFSYLCTIQLAILDQFIGGTKEEKVEKSRSVDEMSTVEALYPELLYPRSVYLLLFCLRESSYSIKTEHTPDQEIKRRKNYALFVDFSET